MSFHLCRVHYRPSNSLYIFPDSRRLPTSNQFGPLPRLDLVHRPSNAHTFAMTHPPCFTDLPAEIVLNIVEYLVALPHEPGDLLLRDSPPCPCAKLSQDRNAPPKVLQFGKRRVDRYQDVTIALSMINRWTRDVVFGERLKRGLKLGLCEDVLDETREIPLACRNKVT
jgi:hypothetical protein